jgi:hypothetical protein
MSLRDAILVLLLCISTVSAADFYVGKQGCDDSGQGYSEMPFCTIQKAADTVKAGDSVIVKAGNYPEDVIIKTSGSAGNYIEYTTNGAVTLNPGSFSSNGKSFFKIIGFNVQNPEYMRSAFRVIGTGDHVELRDNEVSGTDMTTAGAIEIGGYMSNVIIDGNHVHHCSTGTAEAIKVFQHVSNFQITNNLVEYNTNIGIVVNGWARWGKPSNGLIKGNTVRYNSIEAPWSAGIYLDCSNDIIVEENVAYGNIRGFQLGCEEPGDISENNIMRNNIAYENTESGIQMGGYQGGITKNNQVYNNVFYNDGVRELGFDGTPGFSNEIFNNIFYNPGKKLVNGEGANNLFDHNVYYDYGGPGTSNIKSNPLFVGAPSDFTLQASSPVCTAGRDGKYAGAKPCAGQVPNIPQVPKTTTVVQEPAKSTVAAKKSGGGGGGSSLQVSAGTPPAPARVSGHSMEDMNIQFASTWEGHAFDRGWDFESLLSLLP